MYLHDVVWIIPVCVCKNDGFFLLSRPTLVGMFAMLADHTDLKSGFQNKYIGEGRLRFELYDTMQHGVQITLTLQATYGVQNSQPMTINSGSSHLLGTFVLGILVVAAPGDAHTHAHTLKDKKMSLV